jgi:hypothetical protein
MASPDLKMSCDLGSVKFKFFLGRLCTGRYDGEEQQDAHELFAKMIKFLDDVPIKNQPYKFGENFCGQMKHSIK